jgi:pSer/pThr/pTyr-binding forkhead associated (FHA) protein
MPRLVDAQGNAYFLNDTTVMGREETADIAFPGETTLSRRHAEVTTQNGTISIRDLGSTNGTFVNGVRNDGTPVVLNVGDQVQLGAVKFRYEV